MKALMNRMIVCGLCLGAGAAFAQDVTLRVLMPYEGTMVPAGRPALDRGVFTAYGVNRNPSRAGIYMGALTDSPPPGGVPVTFIAQDGTTLPNNPPRTFGRFGTPTVWDGTSYFSGGPSGSTVNDGVYAGRLDGSPLITAIDRLVGEPWIDASVAGESGLAYIHPGFSNGSGAGMSLFTYWHARVPIVSYADLMPGGGSMQSTSVTHGDGWISQGGGTVAYSVLCNAPGGSASGVYAYDVVLGTSTLVANWNTPIPGDGRLMTHATGVDTDGARVSFVAANGNPYFGGVHAACAADREGRGLVSVARTGQPVPGVPGSVWKQILLTAIDGDLVYFQASYFRGSSEVYGMFAHDTRSGTTHSLMRPGQVIGGHEILAAWFVPEGIDGIDSVAVCEYITPDQPFLSKNMLVHARIGTRCPADFNADGSLDFFDYDDFVTCFEGAACPPGADADFNGDGSVDFFDYDDFVAAFEGGC